MSTCLIRLWTAIAFMFYQKFIVFSQPFICQDSPLKNKGSKQEKEYTESRYAMLSPFIFEYKYLNCFEILFTMFLYILQCGTEGNLWFSEMGTVTVSYIFWREKIHFWIHVLKQLFFLFAVNVQVLMHGAPFLIFFLISFVKWM